MNYFKYQPYHAPDEGGETGATEGVADQTSTEGQESSQPKEKDADKAFAARLGHEKKKMAQEYEPYKSLLDKQARAAGMDLASFISHSEKLLSESEIQSLAEKTGKSPDVIKAEQERDLAKQEADSLKQKEALIKEEKELSEDPKTGKFFKENIEAIRAIAEEAGVNLRVARAILADQKLDQLLENANPEKHVNEYLEKVKKGAQPVEIGGGATSAPQQQLPKTFADARKASMEMLGR